jgi:16S rRNA (cytidine1402-2'-O)-methyltransferase
MLFIVSTPIGNLEDMTLRAARTLATVDIILAEDTRSAHILLSSLEKNFGLSRNPNTHIISYYKEKEFEKLPEVLDLLKSDKNVALISEAGTPLISDPGSLLTQSVIKKNIPFTVIPGPSAVTTALVLSGLPSKEFLFLGFLPKKETDLIKSIRKMKELKTVLPETTILFYESPARIHDTLAHINEHFPKFSIAICREMTKKFEEVIRGQPSQLLNRAYKGELTVVLH